MSSTEAPAKRQRLEGVVGLKGVSHRALAAIAHRLKDAPVEDAGVSASTLRRVAASAYSEIGVTLDLACEDGVVYKWEICRFDLLLTAYAKRSKVFRDCLLDTLHSSPQLDICLYTDEVSPGNTLALVTHRKFWSFYVSFLQFGERLCYETHWFEVAVLRTSVAKKVVGGISACTGALLKSFFAAPCDFSRGIALDLGGVPIIASARFSLFLADGDAERACWSCKGAAGVRPCFLCKNIVVCRHQADGLLSVGCSDYRLLDLCTDDQVYEAVDTLAAAPVAGEPFKLLERALGFTYLPGSLLFDATIRGFLRPASAHRYDPMHTLVGNGVAHFELANFFCRCLAKIPQFSYALIREYLSADWGTPHHLGVSMQKLKCLFTPLRQTDLAKHTFKCDASPMLALFPLVRHFARNCVLPLGSLGEEVASLEACGRVLDEYVMIKRGGRGDNWADAIRAFLEQHRQTYGEKSMKPKHHWLLHLPSQLRRDGVLVDTFISGETPQEGEGIRRELQSRGALRTQHRGELLPGSLPFLRADTSRGRPVAPDPAMGRALVGPCVGVDKDAVCTRAVGCWRLRLSGRTPR